jgi:hypothetical protein
MNFGASEGPARSIRVPEQFFARYGNGGMQKPKWQIDRHFTFYRTASC